MDRRSRATDTHIVRGSWARRFMRCGCRTGSGGWLSPRPSIVRARSAVQWERQGAYSEGGIWWCVRSWARWLLDHRAGCRRAKANTRCCAAMRLRRGEPARRSHRRHRSRRLSASGVGPARADRSCPVRNHGGAFSFTVRASVNVSQLFFLGRLYAAAYPLSFRLRPARRRHSLLSPRQKVGVSFKPDAP